MSATLKEIKVIRNLMREMIAKISDAENSDDDENETNTVEQKKINDVKTVEKKQASNVKNAPLYSVGHLAKYT